jgi:glyoxylase-like metal-dependent hydrolase (beta-lactamase superfamily II)
VTGPGYSAPRHLGNDLAAWYDVDDSSIQPVEEAASMRPGKVLTGIFAIALCAAPLHAVAAEAPATVAVVKNTGTAKIHTLIAPPDMFANTSHIIELPTQLIIVDGQLYAPYAAQLRAYADKLGKPVTRFYVTHSHADHFLGFGDAFPDVAVYALKETREGIEQRGATALRARMARFGPQLIASKLNVPARDVVPGTETIDGTTFVFERSTDNEAPVSLVIKLPQLGIYIAQDIVFNDIHLFISGPTAGWKAALRAINAESNYDTILPGHGAPGSQILVDQNLAYLDTVDAIRSEAKTAAEYKEKLLKAYAGYGGLGLLDIYLPIIYPQ